MKIKQVDNTYQEILTIYIYILIRIRNIWVIYMLWTNQFWGYLSFKLIVGAETKWPPFRRWHFQMHLHEWKILYFDVEFHRSLFPRAQLTNKSALVQIMAWHQTGDKSLSEQWWLFYKAIHTSLDHNELSLRISCIVHKKYLGNIIYINFCCFHGNFFIAVISIS